MQEKRSETRIPIDIKLSVSDLYPEDMTGIIEMSSPIEVTDISPKGIGFLCDAALPVGFMFIANIELDKELPQIITDIRIIRSQSVGDGLYHYGSEFVSISPRVAKMLDDFKMKLRSS